MNLASKNIEPIPGYTLRERLGSGGYGEVWKADVPGGLAKAVKLVYGQLDGDRATNELKALNRIKSLRHPFLLSIERIEVVDGQLMIVTELAECSLKDLFDRRRGEGMPGIPRGELMQYMRDAADALDYINEHHSLQHLDIKPENLLLIGGHVKVADFGLVKDVHEGTASVLGGLTPLYAAPELFNGTPSRRSDQYSLAILYQHMLTGTLPFPGKSTSQLANQHLNARPLVFALPPGDRKVIARALAKNSQQRFSSCREMVDFLQNDLLQNSLPGVDSWFSEISSPTAKGSAEEQSNATVRLGTPGAEQVTRSSEPACPEMAVTADISAPAEVRRPSDMFEDLEEAEACLHNESIDTRVLRDAASIQIENIAAPVLTGAVNLRPTVVVGIGRLAGIVLQKIKQQLRDRLGAEEWPTLEFLLLDTDHHDLMRAGRGDDGDALTPQELLHTPLRKSQDYRSEGQALLSWISRRWLFNIPRSQKTEGLRPLGRLALVDHARTVHARLKKAIQRVALPENRAAAQDQLKLAVEGAPRVIVIGASCGGTAGGMLLDVGLIARQMLDRLGYEDREVLGFLVHYLGRNAATHELAQVNSFSTLVELAHYSQNRGGYPGDPSCGLEPRERDTAPFHQTYVVPLGEHLPEEQLAQALEPLANYLYLDTLTPAAEFFTASRNQAAAKVPEIRTLGSYQLGTTSSELIPWTSLKLCEELMSRWSGERHPLLSEIEHVVEGETKSQIAQRQFSYPALQQRILCELCGDLPRLADSHFRSLVRHGEQPLGPAGLAMLDFRLVLEQLNASLGKREVNSLGDVSNWPKLLNDLATGVAQLADAEISFFTQFIHSLLNQIGIRTSAGLKAQQILVRELSTFNETARSERQYLEAECHRLEWVLGLEETAASAKLNPLRKSPHEYEKQFQAYVQTRLKLIGCHFMQVLYRRMSTALAKLGEQINDTRRELKGLLSHYQPGAFQPTVHNSVDTALSAVISQRLEETKPDLITKLDQWMQNRLELNKAGFLETIIKGGQQREQWMKELLLAARRCVMHSLQEIDLANFLTSGTGEHITSALKLAQPPKLAKAKCQTLLALSATSQSMDQVKKIAKEVMTQIGTTPALAVQEAADFTIVCESSGLPIGEVAQRLIDFRSDLGEYAQRIYSRNDIPFQTLSWEPGRTE